MKAVYFKNLDAIRFIAALMVFFAHGMHQAFKHLSLEGTVWGKLLGVLSNGGAGVSIFFVLSGFLITYLILNEHESNGSISIQNFYVRRVLRIWPLYFLVIGYAFFFYPSVRTLLGMEQWGSTNVLYYLTFLGNFDELYIFTHHPGHDTMSQGITWSVAVEEQFYLVWPLLFVLLPKKFWSSAMVAIILGSLGFRLLHNQEFAVLYFHTFSVLLDLALGGLMAYAVKESSRIRSFFERSSTITHIVFFSFAFLMLYFQNDLHALKYGIALERLVTSFSFALIIAAQALSKSDSKLNLSNLSFAHYWGKYTYGIYLLHPIAITIADLSFRILHIPQNNFLNLSMVAGIAFILTLIISKLSYDFYESRFLVFKQQFSANGNGITAVSQSIRLWLNHIFVKTKQPLYAFTSTYTLVRVKELEQENLRLKQVCADLDQNNRLLLELMNKNSGSFQSFDRTG